MFFPSRSNFFFEYIHLFIFKEELFSFDKLEPNQQPYVVEKQLYYQVDHPMEHRQPN